MLSDTEEDYYLDRVEEERVLVVLFSHSLKFGDHISTIAHKANRLLGLMKRSFSYLEPQVLRPHLDYACVVWNPYQSGDIRLLEQVQRRVTRASPSLSHLSYLD